MTDTTDLPAQVRDLRARLLPLTVPVERSGNNRGTELRPAAVLIILFPREDQLYLLLTARPHNLTRHPGQISLPGGAHEPEDQHLAATALRETREELGVAAAGLQLLGRLPSFTVQASGYRVAPFVAWSPVVPAVHPDPLEVAEVIEVPLAALLDSETVADDIWELRGSQWRVTYYRLEEWQVWGATARILSELVARVRGGGPAPDRGPGSVTPA